MKINVQILTDDGKLLHQQLLPAGQSIYVSVAESGGFVAEGQAYIFSGYTLIPTVEPSPYCLREKPC